MTNIGVTFAGRLWSDQNGASAAEYALILAIIGGGIAIAALALGNSISIAVNNMATCLSSNGNNCP